MARLSFRPFVPEPGQSAIAGGTAREHARARLERPRAQELFATWGELAREPFRGMTTDGEPRRGLFERQPSDAPTPAIMAAARAFLNGLSPQQLAATLFPADSEKWRAWQNTEIYIEHHGLRLEEVSPAIRDAAMEVLRASLSAKGFETSRTVMKLNAFLGELVGGPGVLGEWSYTFCIFGEPSETEPWGWQLFGHHLALHCMLVGRQMVLTPSFLGAEPNYADAGRFKGLSAFEDEERAGLDLMRSLDSASQSRAIVAHSMAGGDHPPGRWHFADHFQLGGAHRDNRIVPFEGLPAGEMSALQRRNLLDLIEAYVAPLPDGPRAARMAEVERHLAETHFCWIGGFDEVKPFYYRVQGPVIFIEFDHHSGVFLTNTEAARFHVHTIVRTPNGNDYGMDLLRLHYKQSHHHRHGHRN